MCILHVDVIKATELGTAGHSKQHIVLCFFAMQLKPDLYHTITILSYLSSSFVQVYVLKALIKRLSCAYDNTKFHVTDAMFRGKCRIAEG